ncbi:MAG: sensor histidine kinase [Leptothrix sp. (in: Bacteria)]|nr:sensor histidine kinase [Leptothrix sp. (in: b-proteobacteria)]
MILTPARPAAAPSPHHDARCGRHARGPSAVPACQWRAAIGALWGPLFALLVALWCIPSQARTWQIDVAQRAYGAAPAYPASAPALRVALPDEWDRTRQGRRGPVWYRAELPALPGDADDPHALFIEHVCSSLEVFLNGEKLHSGGRMSPPYAHNCNHPQLVALPAALLRSTGNVLDIKLVGHPLEEVGSRLRAGSLSAMTVGPQSVLAARHARLTALQVWAPQAVSATLLLMGGFMFVLGFVNRRESHLAYFGALCVGWALVSGRLWLRSMPLGHSETEFLVSAMLGFIAWAAVQFVLRHAGLRHRVADVGLPLQCALLAVSLVLAGPQRLHAVVNAWYVLLAAEMLAALGWHLHHQRRARARWAMGGVMALVMLVGAIEFAAQWLGELPSALTRASHVLQLGVPLLFVLVGLRLVQQHGRALQHAEQDKAALEQRVREATVEIERNFRQMAELRVEQVTERERKRIAADLHDDLGAKLLTIVHTSESERISTLAREALEEMRLSVRGLTGRPVRLADALGDWRAEVVSRLGQAGIEGDWSAPEDLPQTLSARAYVQTTRILREATSNIIKHSGATRCTVKAGIAGTDLEFVVQDNGNGISSEIDGRLDRGHGLASMKNRAKQLQGQCLVESAPGYGTVIRLTVPLDRATQAS